VTLPFIVSASRRTDVPVFHAEWFFACLSRGIAEYRNPYSGNPAAVSLSRDRVAAFVFRTRDPRPVRPGCLGRPSRIHGSYHTCRHECLCCYAA
jgi:hypothetical protein